MSLNINLERFKSKTVRCSGDFRVYFLGDVHYSLENRDRFKRVIREISLEIRACDFIVFLGDELDLGAEQDCLGVLQLGGTGRVVEEIDKKQYFTGDLFLKDLRAVRGNVLGFLVGNHNWRFNTGVHAGRRMVEYLSLGLGIEDLGGLCVLNFKRSGYEDLNIILSHCLRGGSSLSGSLRNLFRLREVISDGDIYVGGHTHELYAVTRGTYINRFGKPEFKEQIFCRAGTLLAGPVETGRSYTVPRLLPPSVLGYLCVEFSVRDGKWRRGVELRFVS